MFFYVSAHTQEGRKITNLERNCFYSDELQNHLAKSLALSLARGEPTVNTDIVCTETDFLGQHVA